MRPCSSVLWALAALLGLGAAARADQVLLSLRGGTPDGLAVAEVDLTAAAAWCRLGPVEPHLVRLFDESGKPLPAQFVPGPDFDPLRRVAGKVVAQLGAPNAAAVRLEVDPGAAQPDDKPFDGGVTTPWARIVHNPARHGGLPSALEFPATGKHFTALRWGDRLHHRRLGSFTLAGDAQAKVQKIAAGPLCTVVRVRVHYVQGGKRPDSQPEALYDWHYFHDRPLVLVTARLQQQGAFTWDETHFLELTTPDNDFLHWAGGDPPQQGRFAGGARTFGFPGWGALVDGRNAIGMFGCGQVLFYDHLHGHATYMQAHGDTAWRAWSDPRLERAGWLWLGAQDNPAEAVRAAARSAARPVRAVVQVQSIQQAIAQARRQVQALPPEVRRQAWWRAGAAEQLQERGRFAEALQAAAGAAPAGWTLVSAGDLGLALERRDDGLRLAALHDATADRRLSAAAALPLFRVTLRHAQTGEQVALTADRGWNRVEVKPDRADAPRALEIGWRRPQDARLGELEVAARADLDAGASAIRWTLAIRNVAAPWSVWQTTFPRLSAAELGPGTRTLFPRGCGEVQADAGPRGFRYDGRYPAGWTTLPLLAAYAADGKTGLYCAIHDPLGSTKEVAVAGQTADRSVVLSFEHPAPDMGRPGNGFTLAGEAIWQLFRGDWFDAALIYRQWARRHARWFPKLGPDGRADTPLWMRELPVWVMTGGGPAEVEKPVRDFAATVGLPVGFHWYSWHQIPFDNDYPHYFPTKAGFTETVGRLQQAGVHVMPYINGRLWDTRDRGQDDLEFTKVARPAASKDQSGEPHLERYGSKEKDGSPVALAAMCPTTPLWQDKVSSIVARLFRECGTHGVYIDQVAAAAPTLCFDPAHGHPWGGGHWWTQGYWTMLERIRRDRPADRMLTTECNAEPFLHGFDGYLTWHWQYDGQVPMFPAIYGGAIQMFGRAYRGGPTKALALRMKAGQQLVFGEQIGWFDPREINDQASADFLLPLLKLRWDLRRYFHAGEMARSPRLGGTLPRVTADWQWSGVWPVTTDAVLTGAWRLPAENKLVLLFVNVSDQPVTTQVEFDATAYGFTGPTLRITPRPGEAFDSPPRVSRTVTFPPGQASAWAIE